MRSVLVTLLLIYCVGAYGQRPKPGNYEKRWAVCHPFAAIKVKKITKKVLRVFELSQSDSINDSYTNGGKLDAYRHVFFMAAFAQKVKTKKIRRLGEVHEKWNYVQYLMALKEFGERPDSLSSVMDLKNNELGFELGMKNRKVDLMILKQLVKQEIIKGNAWIMKRNKAGLYLDCEGAQIDKSTSQKKWSVPKCLVSSNYIYKD